MSEDRKPQKGDRVRVTYEATYVRAHDIREGCHVVRVPDDTNTRVTLASASLEVLEPADDPSKDDVGTLRREDHRDQDPPGVSLWQCIHRPAYGTLWLCVHSTSKGNLEAVLDHVDVVGMPVIGAVPGTPASEAQTPLMPWELGPRPISVPLGSVTVDGKPMPLATPPLSEYSQHLRHKSRVDDCTLCPPAREAREFESDGPEPPEDVRAVISVHCSDRPSPYFIRRSDGWECSDRTVGSGSGARVPWRSTKFYGLGSTFMEVQP